jgi:hypothetical protein
MLASCVRLGKTDTSLWRSSVKLTQIRVYYGSYSSFLFSFVMIAGGVADGAIPGAPLSERTR